MPCSGELVGRGELRRSIGMVSLNFCFIPISFLFRFMTCSKDCILVFHRKKGTEGVFLHLRG
jgi:hypothetical protein